MRQAGTRVFWNTNTRLGLFQNTPSKYTLEVHAGRPPTDIDHAALPRHVGHPHTHLQPNKSNPSAVTWPPTSNNHPEHVFFHTELHFGVEQLLLWLLQWNAASCLSCAYDINCMHFWTLFPDYNLSMNLFFSFLCFEWRPPQQNDKNKIEGKEGRLICILTLRM